MKGKTLKVLMLCGIGLALTASAAACGGKEDNQDDGSIVLYSFEQGILPVGMNSDFGSLDINENADYVKNGARSLVLRPVTNGTSDPLMYFPFASDYLGINYTNGDKMTEVNFWCYAPKAMTVDAGLYFSSFARKRSFTTPLELKEGWQRVVYKLDHETLAVVNNMKSVQGFYLSFPKEEVPASANVTLYIDDLAVKTVKEELVYTPKIPELIKETGDIITFQNVNFSVVEQESAGVSDWYEEFEGAQGVLQIEANTGWPWYRNRTFWKPAFEKETYAEYEFVTIRAYATGVANAWYQLEDRSVETGGVIEYQMDFTADKVGRWVDFVYPIEKFNTYFDRLVTEAQFMTYADSKTKIYIDSIRVFNEIEGDYVPEKTDYKTGEKVDLRVSLGEGYEGAAFTYSVNGIKVADPSEYVFEKAGIYTVSIEGVLDGKLVRGGYDITVEIYGEEVQVEGKSVQAGGTIDLVPTELKEAELANLTFTFTLDGKPISDPAQYTVALSPGEYEVAFEARKEDGYLYYGRYTLTVLVYGEKIEVADTSAGGGETVNLVPDGLFERYPNIKFNFTVNGKKVADPTQYTLSTASGRYAVSFEGRRASDSYLYYGSYILSVGNKDAVWADVTTFDTSSTAPNSGDVTEAEWLETYEGANGVLKMHVGVWKGYMNTAEWKPIFGNSVYDNYTHIAFRVKVEGFEGTSFKCYYKVEGTGGATAVEYCLEFTANTNGWTTVYLPIDTLKNNLDGFAQKTQFVFLNNPETNATQTYFYLDGIRAVNYESVNYEKGISGAMTENEIDLTVSELATDYAGVTFNYFVNGVKAENPSAYVFETEGEYTVTYEGVSNGKHVTGSYRVSVARQGTKIEVSDKTAQTGRPINLIPQELTQNYAAITFTFKVNGTDVETPSEFTAPAEVGGYEVTFEGTDANGDLYYGSYTLNVGIYGEKVTVADVSAGAGESVDLVPSELEDETYQGVSFVFKVDGTEVSDANSYQLSSTLGRYEVTFEGIRQSDGYLYYGNYLISVGNKDAVWADVMTFETNASKPTGGDVKEAEWLETYEGANGVLKMHVGKWKGYMNKSEWKPIFGKSVYDNYTHIAFRVKVEGFEGTNFKCYYKVEGTGGATAVEYCVEFTANTNGWTTVYLPIDTLKNNLDGFAQKTQFTFINAPETNDTQTYFYLDSIRAVNYAEVTAAPETTETKAGVSVSLIPNEYANETFNYYVNGVAVQNPSAYVFEKAGAYTVTYDGTTSEKVIHGKYTFTVKVDGIEVTAEDKIAAPNATNVNLIPEELSEYSSVTFHFTVNEEEVSEPSAYTAPAASGRYEVAFEGTAANGGVIYGSYTLIVGNKDAVWADVMTFDTNASKPNSGDVKEAEWLETHDGANGVLKMHVGKWKGYMNTAEWKPIFGKSVYDNYTYIAFRVKVEGFEGTSFKFYYKVEGTSGATAVEYCVEFTANTDGWTTVYLPIDTLRNNLDGFAQKTQFTFLNDPETNDTQTYFYIDSIRAVNYAEVTAAPETTEIKADVAVSLIPNEYANEAFRYCVNGVAVTNPNAYVFEKAGVYTVTYDGTTSEKVIHGKYTFTVKVDGIEVTAEDKIAAPNATVDLVPEGLNEYPNVTFNFTVNEEEVSEPSAYTAPAASGRYEVAFTGTAANGGVIYGSYTLYVGNRNGVSADIAVFDRDTTSSVTIVENGVAEFLSEYNGASGVIKLKASDWAGYTCNEWGPVFGKSVYENNYTHIAFRIKVENQTDGTLVIVYKESGSTNGGLEYKFKSTPSGWTGDGSTVSYTVDTNGWTTVYMPIDKLISNYGGFETKTQFLFYWDDATTKNADFYVDSICAVNYEEASYKKEITDASTGTAIDLTVAELATVYEGVSFSYFVNGVAVQNPSAYVFEQAGTYAVTYDATTSEKVIHGKYTLIVGNKDAVWADVMTFETNASKPSGEAEWLETHDGANGVLKMHVGVWKSYMNTAEWKPIFGKSVYDNYTHIAFRVKVEGFAGTNFKCYYKVDGTSVEYVLEFTANTNGWTTVYLPIDILKTNLEGFAQKTQFMFLNSPETNDTQTYFYLDSIRAVNYEKVNYVPANLNATVGSPFDLAPAELASNYSGVTFTYTVNGVKVENPSAYSFTEAGSYAVAYEGTSENKQICGAYTVTVN